MTSFVILTTVVSKDDTAQVKAELSAHHGLLFSANFSYQVGFGRVLNPYSTITRSSGLMILPDLAKTSSYLSWPFG